MSKYICMYCFHEWDSHPYNKDRAVLVCSNCHRRQGVSYDKFRQAVNATKSALQRVRESPPPHRPPFEVKDDISKALGPVLDVAGEEFPSPVLALNYLKRTLKKAFEELKEESSKKNKEANRDTDYSQTV